MRLLRWIAATVVLSPLAARAPAQEPIRVVRHSPVDTARAGDVITISFDRPVAGSLERSANPERFVRIDPHIRAVVQWRDGVTLGVIPNEPLPPGKRFRITVDTKLTALDGGRLAAPYEFTLVTRGPEFLGSAPPLSVDATQPTWFQPNGHLTLIYSAPVDSARLANVARIELEERQGCEAQVIRYAVTLQRALTDTDRYGLRAIGGYRRGADAQFRRILELEPRTTVPEGCRGTLVIPSADPNDSPEIRYPIATAAPFMVASIGCSTLDCERSQWLSVSFTAPVVRDSLLRRIHLDPPVPFTMQESDGPSATWVLQTLVRPRVTYRVTVDSSVHDVFGRRLTRRLTASITMPDSRSAIGHQLGFFTVSRHHAVLRLSHVNLDSATIAFIPIPDSARTAVFLALADQDSVGRMVERLRDSVIVDVALHAPINEDHITEVSIPGSLLQRYPGGLVAIRARSKRATRLHPDSVVRPARLAVRQAPGAVNQLEEVRIIAAEELTKRVAVVQVTDLAVHARLSDEPGAVLVTDINTGAPIAGAVLSVRDDRAREMAIGTTDSSGVGRLTTVPAWTPVRRSLADEEEWSYGWSEPSWYRNSALFVDVRRGLDRSVVLVAADPYRSSREVGPERSEANAEPIQAMAYTDRAIYRPGEPVYLGAIVRAGRVHEMKPPRAGDSIRVRFAAVSDPTGVDVVRDTVIHLDGFGTAVDSFRLASSTPLGDYTARVDVMTPGGWRRRAAASFRVAEYRAPQFHTSLTLDTAVRFLGDTIRAVANGRYYFGAAMNGAVVRWSARTEDAGGLEVPSLPPGFVVARRYSAGWERGESGGAAWGIDTLDAAGTAHLALPTGRGSLVGPARVLLSVAVEDVDRQTAVAEESRLLQSSAFYVAVRDAGTAWYWKQGERRTFEVLAVEPTGRRVAGQRVRLTIIRRHASWTSQYNGYGGWRWVADTVGRDSLVTTDSIVRASYTPTQDGAYEVAFTARDEHDRPVVTSVGGYAIPPRWFGGWGVDPSALPIRLARDTVAPGDSAKVLVLSPFEHAEAWVTVEREGILSQMRRTVAQGETTFTIPVDGRFIPGVEISVLLVSSKPAWETDSVHQRIRSGSVSLVVDKRSKGLAVDVRTSAPRYAPGDSVDLTIRVHDYLGRPAIARVVVWAVDESVLALTDSTRLSPVDSMYADRGSGFIFASTAPTMASLATLLMPPGWVRNLGLYGSPALNSVVLTGMASASTMIEVTPRTDFRTTAFYLATLATDTNGVVTAAAKLPDNLTAFRLIAVAIDRGDRFGSAEGSLVVTKPLIVRAAMPRFVRTGDEFVAGAVITNQTGADMKSTVKASARAVVLRSAEIAQRPIASGASSEVRFAWKATASAGDTASFRFSVTGGDHADGVETPVVVRPPYSPRFHTIAGVTNGDETIRMMLPPGIDPARSRLTLRVGTTPVAAVHAAYDYLRAYPYVCSEQLTSRGRSLVAMLRLERAGLLDPAAAPSPTSLREQLQWVADELIRRQTPNGGVGYWSGTSWTSGSLTANAGMLLLDARDLGVSVRPIVLDRITSNMNAAVERPLVARDSGVYGPAAARQPPPMAPRLANRLFVLQYLRRVGAPDVVREDQLASLAPVMAWEDRAWLAELLSHRDDKTSARRMLDRVWRDVEVAGARMDIPDSLLRSQYGFPSHVRPVARLLQATLAIDPAHPRLGQLVERVVQQGSATRDRLWNTQDYAAEADALTRVALWQRTSAPATFVIESARRGAPSHEVVRGSATGNASASAPLEGLVERDGDWTVLPLRVSAGNARVFYVLTVDEVPFEPPTRPDAKGLIVERWYERFDDGRPASEVKEGDLIRARIRITVPSDREFVAVADPLPAGLEVVDLSLRTSRTTGPFESDASEAAERAGDRMNDGAGGYYGTWYGGWWSPWEYQETRDDQVRYFARVLWKGTYTASYVARATTSGTFVRPPAHAEEMYNPSLGGRSDGGRVKITPK